MKVLSLFDGIAGARQALKELDVDCEYYASEIDSYAIQVAKNNHPDIIQLGDVRYLGGDKNTKRGYFDLLIGGSPCQDLSIAKKDRKGLEGDRSSLFYEYVRILNEVKPKYFVLENVASMSKESRNKISQELGVEPILINSALLTAQQRKRLYWVGKFVNGKYEQVKIKQPEDKGIVLTDIIPGYKAACMVTRRINPTTLKRDDYNLSIKKSQYLEVSATNKSRCLSTVQKDCLVSKKPVGRYKIEDQKIYLKDIIECDFVKNNKLCEVFNTAKYTTIKKEDNNIRKLTPKECARLQGFPDNYHEGISNTRAYIGYGNSFTVPVIKHILKSLSKSIS